MSRIVVADASPAVASALRGFLEGKYEVRAARDEDETLEAVTSFGADLLVASESERFDAEGLCAALKARDPEFPVILVYAPEEGDPDGRALRAGAEACLQGPLKQGTVLSCVRNVLALAELRGKARMVRPASELPEGDEGLDPLGDDEPVIVPEPRGGPTQAADFGAFRSLLAREVKRSRRYRYPVAFIVLAYDAFANGMPELETTDVQSLLAAAKDLVARHLRDTDLVSAFHPGSWVVFLPHTPAEGAVVVAERLRDKLGGLHRTYLMASAGVSAHVPTEATGDLSFGKLFRDATDALAQARAEGGGRTLLATSGSGEPGGRRRKSRLFIA
ncbi:MAG TPA: diguanylate cyclase [Myxococcaceae bacterium]|nr:diguanylate cyclase [Myxococcaceae bacterium]